MTLARRLREAREKAGLLPHDIPGVSAQAVRDYESDRGVMPGAEAISALCDALEVSADWLLDLRPRRTRRNG